MPVALIFLVVFGIADDAEDDRRKADLARIRRIYEANKNVFPWGELRYTYTRGSAESIDDAKEGLIKNPITVTCRYLFKGSLTLYEREITPKFYRENSRKTGENQYSVAIPAMPLRMLTHEGVTLLDCASLQDREGSEPYWAYNPQIIAGDETRLRGDGIPLGLGIENRQSDDFFADFAQSLAKGDCVLKEARIEKEHIGYVELEFEGGKRELWLDLDRGAIPFRTRDSYIKRNRVDEKLYEELVEVKGKGFFPLVMREIVEGGEIVDIVRIQSYDFDKVPPDSDFSLTFPKPVGLWDVPKLLKYSPRSSWNLLNLPELGSDEAKKVVIRKVVPTP